MLTLLHALQDESADHWRVVAQAWGVEYPASSRDPVSELIVAVLNPERIAEVYRALPPPLRQAVAALRAKGGKIPVAEFFHRFGEIRSMGPARRQREQPWRNPASVSEALWYSGWIGRAFIRAGSGAQEYVFLPGDLEALIPAGAESPASEWSLLSYQPGRQEQPMQAKFRSAQDACTILAYARNWPPPAHRGIRTPGAARALDLHLKEPDALPFLSCLLLEKGLLRGDPLQPEPDTARAFLERTVEESAAFLLKAWRDSGAWNDLAHVGVSSAEAAWPNDPVRARRNFLKAVRAVPRGEWCTIESAAAAIHRTDLEFQRPASEFDVWRLRDDSGEFLRGLDSWDRVEGALVRFYFSGPLAWLGAVETTPRGNPKAFRFTPQAAALWDEESESAAGVPARARIRPDGSLVVLPETAPLLRYQLARCADWLEPKGGAYVYRITPRALARAREQGVRAAHILPLLESLAGKVPAALAGALRRWEERGTEAAVRPGKILLPRNEEAARRIAALAERDRGTLVRLEGPVYVVARLGANRLRTRLIEEGFLLEEEDEG
ncbi:MAG: helicase-associated domain-containing protein [Anaerolineales bacterium]|nr:helicase-associated domain-containing protein [Anaerolineales bacterium]